MSAFPHSVYSYSDGESPVFSEPFTKESGGTSASFSEGCAIPPVDQCLNEAITHSLQADEISPDVIVIPVRLAGAFTFSAAARAANKVAQNSGKQNIAVIYPDIGEPYRSVFAQIITGIEAKAKGSVSNIAVGSDINVDELSDTLKKQDTHVVIALGKQGVKVASGLGGDFGVIAGGVLMPPDRDSRNIQINSLSPDPALLFAHMKSMMPRIRRIHTVFDPRQNEWMIKIAREAAITQGVELIAHEAQDLRSAVNAYQEIFSSMDPAQDAIWLMQDSTTVEESAVLPLVLKESWERNLAVFSSSFAHVRRGVLFSLYPNNVELGRHLAGSALDVLNSGNNLGGMLPLRDVLIAVNLRTARHLGINTSKPQNFDMTFPEQ